MSYPAGRDFNDKKLRRFRREEQRTVEAQGRRIFYDLIIDLFGGVELLV